MTLSNRLATFLRREDGKITWVTVVMVLMLAGGGYVLYVWGPIYMDHYEVKQCVRGAANSAVMNPDDVRLKNELLGKIKSVRNEEFVNAETGAKDRRPVISLQSQDVIWERDTKSTPPTLHIAFDYVRQIRLPIFKKDTEKAFHVDETIEISRAVWDEKYK
jgi:hypothetical protein